MSAITQDRYDPGGVFLGDHANCCQHPTGIAKTSAWYGQESPNSGFFVVTNRVDDIVAMSWAVKNKRNQLLFDDVEAKGLGKREDAVRSLYKRVGMEMSQSFAQINIGSVMSDVSLNSFVVAGAEHFIKHPRDYSGCTL